VQVECMVPSLLYLPLILSLTRADPRSAFVEWTSPSLPPLSPLNLNLNTSNAVSQGNTAQTGPSPTHLLDMMKLDVPDDASELMKSPWHLSVHLSQALSPYTPDRAFWYNTLLSLPSHRPYQPTTAIGRPYHAFFHLHLQHALLKVNEAGSTVLGGCMVMTSLPSYDVTLLKVNEAGSTALVGWHML